MSESLLHVCETLYFPLQLRISEGTRYQYRHALRNYAQHLGRPATLADLTDDQITIWQSANLTSGLSAIYVREMAGRIATLWTWLAKRAKVPTFPTFAKPSVPESMPTALTEGELRRLFVSASKERGRIGGVDAGVWWTSFLAFVWNSAERKSAALAVKVAWLDFASGTCTIPPEVRKGGRKWGCYKLWPETLALVRECIDAGPAREQVWPVDFCHESYYTRYDRILRDAEIPVDRRHKTHALRCSHATWLAVMGGDPTKALGHSDPNTARRHYLDPRFTDRDQPKLFIPWQTQPGQGRG